MVGEGRASHVVGDGLSPIGEAAGAIRHEPLALGGADGGAEVGLARQAAFALATFGRVERDHVVAGLHARDPGPDFQHDSGALMAKYGREDSLRIEPVQGVGVRMTDPGRADLHQNLARPGTFQVDLDDLKRALGLEGDGGAGLHGSPPAKAPESWSRRQARPILGSGPGQPRAAFRLTFWRPDRMAAVPSGSRSPSVRSRSWKVLRCTCTDLSPHSPAVL